MDFSIGSMKSFGLVMIAILNANSYFIYFLDKRKAMKHQSRISENTLLFVSFLFGGIGAWLGMRQFRHKTKHIKFKLLVPISAIITVLTIYFIIRLN